METEKKEQKTGVFEFETQLGENKPSFLTRLICAFLSLIFPGLGQALQQRYLRAFDFLVLYGCCLVASMLFAIQIFKGVALPVVMISILSVPSIIAFFDALFDKSHPGDADTIVRSIFLFVFFYILIIGPFHFISNVIGFKIHILNNEYTQLEPVFLPGDAIVFDLDAYGIQTPGVKRTGELVEAGDIVLHSRETKGSDKKKREVHVVLAAPGDTLKSVNGIVTVNGRLVKLPLTARFTREADFGPIVVPKDELFVVDNSQEFFPIFFKSVIGKAEAILWSKEYGGGFRKKRSGKSFDKIGILFPKDADVDTSDVSIDFISIAKDEIIE